jgi:hypothetical protein
MKKTILKEIKEVNKIAGTQMTKAQEISFIKNRLNELSISLKEMDFRNQAAFDSYQKQHKLRPDTKVTIAGKATTAGQASKSSQSAKGTSVFGGDNSSSQSAPKKASNYTENDIDTGMDIIRTVSRKNFGNNDALDAIEVGLNSLYGDSKTQDMIKNWEKQYTKMGFAGNSLLGRESLRAVVAGLVSMHGEDKVKKLIKGWESDYSKKYM